MRANILFLGINRSYVNPTTDNLIAGIKQFSDLKFYGPGFVSVDVLQNGLKNWLASNLKFDIIITDSMIFEYENLSKLPYLFENEAIYFEKYLYKKYAKELKQYFITTKTTKVFIANWDYYCVKNHQITELKKLARLYVISNTDVNSTLSVERINADGNPLIPDIKEEYPTRSNVWHNFITDHKNIIISAPNTVGIHNFNFTPLADRKYRYCVPGFPYTERKMARKLFNFYERVFHYKIEMFFLVEKVSRKLRIPRPHNWGKIQNERLFYRINNSKICFTSGAVTRTPIAKFFEIPASGSLLICQKFAGFENLGFKNGVNCIVTEDLNEIKSILLEKDQKKHQKIADKGRELVWDKHSSFARAKQLKACFDRIIEGSFNGSCWSDGEYILEK